MQYRVRYSCVCHIGLRRRVNQDNFICAGHCLDPDLAAPDFPLTGCVPARSLPLFGVFDGLGGEERGEMASLIAARAAASAVLGRDPAEGLARLCLDANGAICRFAAENGVSTMGTTAAMLAFTASEAVLCNIGDSRIFRYAGGRLSQISQDHVSVAPYGVKPPLSQNLGIPPEEFAIEPYLARGACGGGDIYLICSDGLTDMVSTREIEEILGADWPGDAFFGAAPALLDRALAAGGRDNVTILTCRVEREEGWLSRMLGQSR